MAKIYLDILGRAKQFTQSTKESRDELRNLNKSSKESNKIMQDGFKKTTKIAEGLKSQLATMFSVAAVTMLAKHIISIRREFEKYHTVLKAALGSQQAANKAFSDLKTLARGLPYSVNELTSSYVKLVNQGFKPTMAQMRQMADVAAVMGKSFDQLTEAIIDATVGEFERLKEFGIRASKIGDQVKFTFRGVEQQVDFTADSIRNYILSLGDLEGITGATTELSKTLEGQFSMLKDATDALADSIGKLAEDDVKGAVSSITSITNSLASLMDRMGDTEDEREEFPRWLKAVTRALFPFALGMGQGRDNMSMFAEGLEELTKRYDEAEVSGLGIEAILGDKKSWQEALTNADQAALLMEKVRLSMIRLKAEGSLVESLKEEQLMLDRQQAAEEALAELRKKMAEDQAAEDEQTLARKQAIEEALAEQLGKIADKELQGEEERKARKIALLGEGAAVAMSLTDLVSARNQAAMEKELAAAEGNEKKQEEIRRKYARKDQAMAVMRAVISGAEGIIKTGANLGYPQAIPFQVLQAIQTAIQIATIKAQKFATGVLDLQGPGTGTSDSIPARLSRGESVMTAAETKEFYPYLKAMKEGVFPRFDVDMVKNLEGGTHNLNYDNSKEIRRLEEIRDLLKESPGVTEYVQGGYRIIKRGNSITRIRLN